MTRLEQQLAFIREIDKEKKILRQTHISGYERQENDAEHAWHMSIMALLLSEYANEAVDLLKVIRMILIHDIVEIDAGDTYAYDEGAKATQREREEKAADRIYGLLPSDQQKLFRESFEEFEAGDTPEARFAHVMDNFQPLLLNDANGGKDWEKHGVHRSQIEKRNARTQEGSKEIWEYMKALLDRNEEAGHIQKG